MLRKIVMPLVIVTLAALPALLTAQEQPEKPTKEHNVLRRDIGNWEATVKVWAAGPNAEPDVSKATERVRPLGKLWITSDYRGTFFGQAFQGHGQTGYDPKAKKYIGTWIDSTSSILNTISGTYDKKTKSLTMKMVGLGPDGAKMEYKNVTQHVDRDSRVMTMYMKQGDNFVKFMEISYKRAKRAKGKGKGKKVKSKKVKKEKK